MRPLTKSTLLSVLRPLRAPHAEVELFGLPRVVLAYVGGDGRTVGGRFFPRVRELGGRPAILVRLHGDPAVTEATVVHECCHHASYVEECGGTPRNRAEDGLCRYAGEHDAEFYARLEPMHRAAGTRPDAAVEVEGDYPFPERWRAAAALGRWP